MPSESHARAGIWLEAARPKTLPAAVIPVLLGSALAHRAGAFDFFSGAICLVFALLVQIGTNFANDYGDFVKGADGPDRRGPRRAVAAGLISAGAMRTAAIAIFGVAFLVGLGLVARGGWWLVPVGLASLLFGWAYTSGPFPLAYHGLGDVFVFIFFGLVAVGGTFFVMAHRLDWSVLLAAAPIGLLATNILVVNNYRDAETDARAGKRTTVVRFGRRFALRQYVWSCASMLIVPAALALAAHDAWLALPAVCWLAGVPLTRALRIASTGPQLNLLLARTAQLLLLFGAVWSAVIAFA